MLGFLLTKKHDKRNAAALYDAAVTQARLPVFYERYDAPDSVDGRFDMICIHIVPVMRKLAKCGRAGDKLSQALFDHFFTQMERALREMGVGDLSVPKHVKRMMKAYKGRYVAYGKALDENDKNAMADVVLRNLYRGENENKTHAKAIADYLAVLDKHVAGQSDEAILSGEITFPDMSKVKGFEDGKSEPGMAA